MTSNNKNKVTLFLLAQIFVVLILSPGQSFAEKNGYPGRTSSTSQGCNCHGNSPGTGLTIQVTSETGSFNVTPGSTTKFTVTISHASLASAGIGIGVKSTANGESNSGTLSVIAGEGLSLKSNELVHSTPKSFSGGTVKFSFNWKAPTIPGTYYLRVIGNATNGNNKADGSDRWNWMTPQAITVSTTNSVSEKGFMNVVSPNPFKEFATINLLELEERGIKQISILDANGNEIRNFPNSNPVFVWDGKDFSGRNVASGVYYLVVIMENEKKIIPFISL